ncbi:serine-protein kinase ATM-like [Spodoptera litura]|uniref:Serine-protein kinase ATM-like n=1 Tax=Spodoptera litura TaxID=69820 RepID=A0A9J7ILE6_SPOLT|nr:serine-protein kinase ATM-like [Spodoptera litura]
MYYRSAIESNSSCVQEFIAKKRTFEDTLSSMTILSWIFGVGDRHLQNIMYNTRDGGVCAVDWATIFKYGRRELPPARLTANLLAVCDVKVLESRLQQLLLFLRNNKKTFETFLKTSFYWLGPEFKELKYINKILRGETVSYTITRECLEESEIKNKDKYIALLDDLFQDFASKDTYTVEEQISYLLRQCIHPSILSVTRSGWEAWI